jgi:hypothetical protein
MSTLDDQSRLDIRGDRIHYRIYRQDGTMQDMDCVNNLDNRLFVQWVQVHDSM